MKNRKNDIERYLRGELSSAEMHALEKEALNDPFLAEALEGVEQAGADNFLYDLHRLNRKVHNRTRHRKDKTIKIWGWTAGMAAAVLLVAVSGFLVISLLKEQDKQQLSMEEESIPPPRPGDSLTVVMPPAAMQARQAPPAERQRTSAGKSESRERSGEQSAGESTAETVDRFAQQDALAKEDGAETAGEIQVEQEPIILADIPEEEPVVSERKEADDQASKKLQGQIAGVQSRQAAPAVARPLSGDVVLLKGKVTSASDGEGLPGVNVTLKGTNVGVVTDALGNYQIPVPAAESNVVFSFIGFEAHEVTVENEAELNVTLHEDVTALSEVVVSGYGANNTNDNAATFNPAAPRGGKGDFKEYLEKALVYPQEALAKKVEGRVTVRFTVQADGQLTDFEVLKGIGHGCDEELIRVIKAGPAWEPASRGEVSLSDKVKVRYKFELP